MQWNCKAEELDHTKIPKKGRINVDNFQTKKWKKLESDTKMISQNK